MTVDRHIICIIHDRIYVFDSHGYLLRFANDWITYPHAKSYALVYLGVEDTYYLSFLVGFITEGVLHLKYYLYHTNNM